jgi:hypothetical protein
VDELDETGGLGASLDRRDPLGNPRRTIVHPSATL